MDKRALNTKLWTPYTHANFAQRARTLLMAQWNLQVLVEENIFSITAALFAYLPRMDFSFVKKIFLYLNLNSMPDLIATIIIAFVIINGLKNHRYKN